MPGASAASASTPPLGVGLTYSSAIEPVLERRPDLVQVLEIEPQTTWLKTRDDNRPYRANEEVLEHLRQIVERSIHGAVRAQCAEDFSQHRFPPGSLPPRKYLTPASGTAPAAQ
jgi:hypothetical protein